jgi:hypothetical protein
MYVIILTSQPPNSTESPTEELVWSHVHVPIASPDGWLSHKLNANIRDLERIHRQVEAAMAVLLAAQTESRDSIAQHSRTTGVSNRESRRRMIIAKVVRAMSEAAKLLSAGEISSEHLAALATVIDKPGAVRLLDTARSQAPEDFVNTVKQFAIASEPAEDIVKRQHKNRFLRFFQGPDGMVGLNGLLPPIEGASLKTMFAAIVDAKYRKQFPNRAEALGGHNPDQLDQRMADALLNMAGIKSFRGIPDQEFVNQKDNDVHAAKLEGHQRIRGSSKSGTSTDHTPAPIADNETHIDERFGGVQDLRDYITRVGRESSDLSNEIDPGSPPPNVTTNAVIQMQTGRPAVVFVFNVDKYEAELLGHGPVPITESLLDQTKADLYYAFQNMRGEVLKFGRAKKDPTPIQRLAVAIRDKRCCVPGCHKPADHCEVHHFNEWLLDHGFTDVEVLGLICKPHHRHLHLNDLVATRERDGTVAIRDRHTREILIVATKTRKAA